MIDGWHGYLDCGACGAKPGAPCISLFTHAGMTAGKTLLSTPHGGRPHSSDVPASGTSPDQAAAYKRLEELTPDHRARRATPAPGPIWSNTMADELTALTEAELEQARATVAHFKAKLVQHWAYAALHYLAQDFTALGWERHKAALLHIIESEEL